MSNNKLLKIILILIIAVNSIETRAVTRSKRSGYLNSADEYNNNEYANHGSQYKQNHYSTGFPFPAIGQFQNYPNYFYPYSPHALHPYGIFQGPILMPPGTYFDKRSGILRPFLGGGIPVLVDYHKRCSGNYIGLKPHPEKSEYYYVCKHDCVIFGKCQNLQVFNATIGCCSRYASTDFMPVCTKEGRYPIYTDCRLYYKCDMYLTPHIYTCPHDMIFSSIKNECIQGNTCAPTQISNNGTFIPENCEKAFPPCLQNGTFRSPTDCSLYFTCNLQKNGIFVQERYKCPASQFYDVEKKKCLQQNKVACDCIKVAELVYPKPPFYPNYVQLYPSYYSAAALEPYPMEQVAQSTTHTPLKNAAELKTPITIAGKPATTTTLEPTRVSSFRTLSTSSWRPRSMDSKEKSHTYMDLMVNGSEMPFVTNDYSESTRFPTLITKEEKLHNMASVVTDTTTPKDTTQIYMSSVNSTDKAALNIKQSKVQNIVVLKVKVGETTEINTVDDKKVIENTDSTPIKADLDDTNKFTKNSTLSTFKNNCVNNYSHKENETKIMDENIILKPRAAKFDFIHTSTSKIFKTDDTPLFPTGMLKSDTVSSGDVKNFVQNRTPSPFNNPSPKEILNEENKTNVIDANVNVNEPVTHTTEQSASNTTESHNMTAFNGEENLHEENETNVLDDNIVIGHDLMNINEPIPHTMEQSSSTTTESHNLTTFTEDLQNFNVPSSGDDKDIIEKRTSSAINNHNPEGILPDENETNVLDDNIIIGDDTMNVSEPVPHTTERSSSTTTESINFTKFSGEMQTFDMPSSGGNKDIVENKTPSAINNHSPKEILPNENEINVLDDDIIIGHDLMNVNERVAHATEQSASTTTESHNLTTLTGEMQTLDTSSSGNAKDFISAINNHSPEEILHEENETNVLDDNIVIGHDLMNINEPIPHTTEQSSSTTSESHNLTTFTGDMQNFNIPSSGDDKDIIENRTSSAINNHNPEEILPDENETNVLDDNIIVGDDSMNVTEPVPHTTERSSSTTTESYNLTTFTGDMQNYNIGSSGGDKDIIENRTSSAINNHNPEEILPDENETNVLDDNIIIGDDSMNVTEPVPHTTERSSSTTTESYNLTTFTGDMQNYNIGSSGGDKDIIDSSTPAAINNHSPEEILPDENETNVLDDNIIIGHDLMNVTEPVPHTTERSSSTTTESHNLTTFTGEMQTFDMPSSGDDKDIVESSTPAAINNHSPKEILPDENETNVLDDDIIIGHDFMNVNERVPHATEQSASTTTESHNLTTLTGEMQTIDIPSSSDDKDILESSIPGSINNDSPEEILHGINETYVLDDKNSIGTRNGKSDHNIINLNETVLDTTEQTTSKTTESHDIETFTGEMQSTDITSSGEDKDIFENISSSAFKKPNENVLLLDENETNVLDDNIIIDQHLMNANDPFSHTTEQRTSETTESHNIQTPGTSRTGNDKDFIENRTTTVFNNNSGNKIVHEKIETNVLGDNNSIGPRNGKSDHDIINLNETVLDTTEQTTSKTTESHYIETFTGEMQSTDITSSDEDKDIFENLPPSASNNHNENLIVMDENETNVLDDNIIIDQDLMNANDPFSHTTEQRTSETTQSHNIQTPGTSRTDNDKDFIENRTTTSFNNNSGNKIVHEKIETNVLGDNNSIGPRNGKTDHDIINLNETVLDTTEQTTSKNTESHDIETFTGEMQSTDITSSDEDKDIFENIPPSASNIHNENLIVMDENETNVLDDNIIIDQDLMNANDPFSHTTEQSTSETTQSYNIQTPDTARTSYDKFFIENRTTTAFNDNSGNKIVHEKIDDYLDDNITFDQDSIDINETGPQRSVDSTYNLEIAKRKNTEATNKNPYTVGIEDMGHKKILGEATPQSVVSTSFWPNYRLGESTVNPMSHDDINIFGNLESKNNLIFDQQSISLLSTTTTTSFPLTKMQSFINKSLHNSTTNTTQENSKQSIYIRMFHDKMIAMNTTNLKPVNNLNTNNITSIYEKSEVTDHKNVPKVELLVYEPLLLNIIFWPRNSSKIHDHKINDAKYETDYIAAKMKWMPQQTNKTMILQTY